MNRGRQPAVSYATTDTTASDRLVEQYAPLVKKLAYHLVGRLPATVLVDDLIQAGMLGLLDAAGHYDPTQGASFETYATIRIRGAMLDELRRNDWAPKSVHRRAREVSNAIQAIEAETGQEAGDQQIAERMGISLDEYFQILQETSSSKLMSFEESGAEPADSGTDQLTEESESVDSDIPDV